MIRSVVTLLTAILALLGSSLAAAWWNDDWDFRKQITIDTSATGVAIANTVQEATVLVRLHLGNFAYFGDTLPGGEDLRFIASDDVTPLDFHIQTYDPVAQIAMIWVKVPQVLPATNSQSIYLYYGNADAPAASNVPQTYDKSLALVMHFDPSEPTPRDTTAYGNHAIAFTGSINPASYIGAGATFAPDSVLRLPDSPSLRMDGARGWTFDAWVRVEQPQSAGRLLELSAPTGGLVALEIDGVTPKLVTDLEQGAEQAVARSSLGLGTWQHVALTGSASGLELYLDGELSASLSVSVAGLSAVPSIGAASTPGQGLASVQIDELRFSNVARPAAWIQLAANSSAMNSFFLFYGEDAQRESGESESYFVITLRNVTVDGWVVIAICVLMGIVSWYVMAAKGVAITRARKENNKFIEAYKAQMGVRDLYSEQFAADDNSTLATLYDVCMREVEKRFAGGSVGAARAPVIGAEALQSIRAELDATNVRLGQKLNNQMVLLTLAISGGPFLGLLGTVIGVMITFAAIAASGDVNVNAIAPGIAAALAATVAGLAVAIPALFGYNYLGSRIKEIAADNQVFVDELVATLAEQYGDS